MDTNILTEATLLFKQASLGWAEAMRPFTESLLFDFILLQWTLLGLAYIFHVELGSLLGTMFRFLIGNGFALFMVRWGWEYVDSWFNGVKRVAHFLGSPDLDPSAVAAWGWVIVDPITKSLAEQGFLSYATNPATWVFGLGAVLALLVAFAILAFILMGLLITSYFLTAACPWFFMWSGFSGTRGITLGYVRILFGTMNGLFCVMLMIAIVSELGELLQVQLRTEFLNPAVALTWQDYVVPLVVGIVLCFLFVWLPYTFTRAVDGVMMNWAGGYMMSRAGYAAASSAGRMVTGGGQGQGQSSTGQGGSQSQLPAPLSVAPPQQTQRSEAWGRRS